MPAVASPDIGRALSSRVTAVISGNDVVARCSLRSAMRLRNAVLRLAKQPEKAAAVLANAEINDVADQLEDLFGCGEEVHALIPPGRVIWVPPEGEPVIVECPEVAFQDVWLVGPIFTPHLPQNYVERLTGRALDSG